jgi:small-conductance mechanosensitive channel
MNIWRLYNEAGISIPFAQREVRIIGGAMPVTGPPAQGQNETPAGEQPQDQPQAAADER